MKCQICGCVVAGKDNPHGRDWDDVVVCVECLHAAPVTPERVREWLEEWEKSEGGLVSLAKYDDAISVKPAIDALAAMLAEKMGGR